MLDTEGPSASTGESTDHVHPISGEEFEIILLDSDPSKGVKIGADLPDLAKRYLKACLKENTNMFAWSEAVKQRRLR